MVVPYHTLDMHTHVGLTITISDSWVGTSEGHLHFLMLTSHTNTIDGTILPQFTNLPPPQ